MLSFIPSMVKHQAATRAVLEGSADAAAVNDTEPVTGEPVAGEVHTTEGALDTAYEGEVVATIEKIDITAVNTDI